MALPWRSRFVHNTGGDEVDWTTDLPVRAWRRWTVTVGGARTAAGGVPASHVVRTDYNLWLTLRLHESELADLAALIQWGLLAEYFTWYPDADDTSTSYAVYLEFPRAGDEIEEERDDEYPDVLEVAIALRKLTPSPWTLEYFADADEELGS
jgi:hypothetical protein